MKAQSPHYTTPFGITSQFAFCGLPLRLDSYKGCSFNCNFCFARYRGGYNQGDGVLPADPQSVRRTMAMALQGSTTGLIAQFLRRRVPIHFGGMSDPFHAAEARYGVTKSI